MGRNKKIVIEMIIGTSNNSKYAVRYRSPKFWLMQKLLLWWGTLRNYLNNRRFKIRHSFKTGFCFGLTSGVITTLGLMVGLHSGTHSKIVVIGGILTIAIADAFSDALGIHISEEAENKHTIKEIWESTAATLLSKFVFALTFIIPILLFRLSTAIIVSVIWGLFLLGIFSFQIAKDQKTKSWKVVTEHIVIALIVIILTHYIGDWIGSTFG